MKYIRVYINDVTIRLFHGTTCLPYLYISDRFIDTGIIKRGIVYPDAARQTDDGIWNNAMRGGYTRAARFDIIELGIILNHGRAIEATCAVGNRFHATRYFFAPRIINASRRCD